MSEITFNLRPADSDGLNFSLSVSLSTRDASEGARILAALDPFVTVPSPVALATETPENRATVGQIIPAGTTLEDFPKGVKVAVEHVNPDSVPFAHVSRDGQNFNWTSSQSGGPGEFMDYPESDLRFVTPMRVLEVW